MIKGITSAPGSPARAPRQTTFSTPPKATSPAPVRVKENKGERVDAPLTATVAAAYPELKAVTAVILDLDETGIIYNSDGGVYCEEDASLLSTDKMKLRQVIPHYDALCALLSRHPDIILIVVTQGSNKGRAIQLLKALGVPPERYVVFAFDAERLQKHLNPALEFALLQAEIKEAGWPEPYMTHLPTELDNFKITAEQLQKIAELWDKVNPCVDIGKTLHILLGMLTVLKCYRGINIEKILFCDDRSDNTEAAELFLAFIQSERFLNLTNTIEALVELSTFKLPAIKTILAKTSKKPWSEAGAAQRGYLTKLSEELGGKYQATLAQFMVIDPPFSLASVFTGFSTATPEASSTPGTAIFMPFKMPEPAGVTHSTGCGFSPPNLRRRTQHFAPPSAARSNSAAAGTTEPPSGLKRQRVVIPFTLT